jgi:hypothetical protein
MRERDSSGEYNHILQSAVGRQFFFRLCLKRSVDHHQITDANVGVSTTSSYGGGHVRALAIELVATEYDIQTDVPPTAVATASTFLR